MIEKPKKTGFNIPRVIVDGLEKGAKRRMYQHPCAKTILDKKEEQNTRKELD